MLATHLILEIFWATPVKLVRNGRNTTSFKPPPYLQKDSKAINTKKIQFFDTPFHPQKKFTKFHLYCRKPDKLPPVTMKEVMTKPEWVSLYLPEPLDNSIYSQLQEKVTNVNSTVRSQIFLYQFLHMKYEYGKIVKQLDVCRVVTFSFVVGVLVCFFGGGGG